MLLQIAESSLFASHALSHENFDAYNRVAREALAGSGVVIWDSTVPLSRLYIFQCWRVQEMTPVTFWWKCKDELHVGYNAVEQYADMLLNHVCNKYMSLASDYC